MNPFDKNNKLRFVLAAALLLVVLLFLSQMITVPIITEAPTKNDANTQKEIIDPFANIKIQAKAAQVYDLTNGQVIFKKNENMVLPLASITKLVTIFTASKILNSNEVITVSTSSLAIEGESGLKENERWLFKDLRDFTLMVSSNDGANAVALTAAKRIINSSAAASAGTTTLQQIFVHKMNDEVAVLNLSTLHFVNESGLDVDKTTPSALGSAADVSKFFEYLIKNYADLIEITKYSNFKFTSLSGFEHNVSNTDSAISQISRIVASKTGYTDLAGGNLVVIYDPGLNHPIIIVVLGSTLQGRFDDIAILASSTSAYIKNTI